MATRRDPPKGIPRTILPTGIAPGIVVDSFEGRKGTVVAVSGDYDVSEVTGAAPLASPTFTGVPAAPTATTGTNTTQIATTAFVQQEIGALGGGTVTSFETRTGAVVSAAGDYDVSEVTGAAPLASPTFTGVPAAPTAAPGTNTTQIATTAYVQGEISGAGVSSFETRTGAVVSQAGDYTAAEITNAWDRTGVALAPDGAVGAPAYSFTSDTDCGIYLATAVLHFAIAGVSKLNISATAITAAVGISTDGSFTQGSAPVSNAAFYTGPSLTISGTTQYGYLINPTHNTATTIFHFQSSIRVAAAATVGNARAFYVTDPTLLAGASITTLYGLYVDPLTAGGTNYAIYTGGAGVISLGDILRIRGTTGIVCANAALATTATAGFLYIPSCAGTPTGTPTTETGTIPIVYDSTNSKLYRYNSGWAEVGGGAASTEELQSRQRSRFALERGTTAAAVLQQGFTYTGTGTISQPTPTDTSISTRLRRQIFTGTTAVNQLIGPRQNETDGLWPKSGYLWSQVCGDNININGSRFFTGFSTSATPIGSGDPSALTNVFGFGWDSGDSSAGNWYCIHNDATGVATKTDTGVARTATAVLRFKVETTDGTSYDVSIYDYDSATEVYSATITTNLPVATTSQRWSCQINNLSTGVAPVLIFVNMFTQTGPTI